jgi:L-ascorbate metabolism protein UlaG (beta-lactamase superfamily)
LQYKKRSYFLDPVRRNILLQTTLDTGNEKDVCGIFISHDHWDHLDCETILMLSSPNTNIYCPGVVANSLYHRMSFEAKTPDDFNELKKGVIPVTMGEIIDLYEIKIKCIEASEGNSYLIFFGEQKMLFMGDSVANNEMISEEPDIVLFPVWAVRGEEAEPRAFLELATGSKCIPMHYHHNPDALPNFYVSHEDFQDLLNMDVDIEILERNKSYQI